MKYMGSKRMMLQNGLGQVIRNKASKAQRVVDLFCGGASISWFVAEQTSKPVLAVDLQTYAVVLAESVLCRTQKLDAHAVADGWMRVVREKVKTADFWKSSIKIESIYSVDVETTVKKARLLCSNKSTSCGSIWSAYGGYYYSPKQSLILDYMLRYLPEKFEEKTACLAATISAASKCAAAPGHTAQPFSPTNTAGRFIIEAWKRDPLVDALKTLENICSRHAQCVGTAKVDDAINVASELTDRDLVILDPPYSDVQYSRFYHVLETLARGGVQSVSGKGRYPAIQERPQSVFSNKSQSVLAIDKLLQIIGSTGASAIITFPNNLCSNGLSGEMVKAIACKYFQIEEKIVNGRFSTLGGNNLHRAARQAASELILYLYN